MSTHRRIGALGLAFSFLLLGACGDDSTDTTAMRAPAGDASWPSNTEGAAATGALCEAWSAGATDDSSAEGDDELTALIAAAAPDELADDVALATALDQRDRDAMDAGEDAVPLTEDEEAAINRVLVWVQDACAGSVLKVAPPLADLPDGLEVCAAFAMPPTADARPAGQVAVYAPGDAADPYAGPVVALVWGTESHAGDGETTPVTVRGTEGVVAPITAFQQVVLEDLGSVVAWSEGDVSFGLYGRGWDLSRADELVAMADAITADDAGYAVPTQALPTGFEVVHTGSSDASGFVGSGEYSVSLVPADDANADDPDADLPARRLITLTGSASSPGSEELWRVFALASERTTIDGRQVAFSAGAWGAAGPVMASWREDADHHVTVMALGPEAASDADLVRDLVAASRPLTADEWTELASAASSC
jgi:hypothetical protein